MRKVVVHARSVAKHEFPGTGVRFIMFIPGFGFLLYQSPSIVHPPCGIGAGGRPFLVLISLPKTESRVPRPRDFCEGGNDTANTTGSEERFVVMRSHSRPLLRKERGIRNSTLGREIKTVWKARHPPFCRARIPVPALCFAKNGASGTLVWERDQKPTGRTGHPPGPGR